jgi:hypothetical protein
MAVPSSLERIEPLPPIALDLLNRIPLGPGDNPWSEDGVQCEPALFKEIIQVVIKSGRSALPGASPDESIMGRVSPADLTEIAITISVHDYLRRAFNVPEDRGYWHYILACAVCCTELAAPAKENSLLAYAAGLLHDIGRLALIQAYPERYANLLSLTDKMFATEQPLDILHYERMLFGLDHFATAEWLADLWKLPPWLRPIVGKFDNQASKGYQNLVATVRSGTRLAHSLGFGYLQAAPRTNVDAILSKLPGPASHWAALDIRRYGEEYMRSKIQSRLKWYAILSAPNAST